VLWAASWLLLFLPDLLLYWSGYSVEAAVRFKAILFTAVAALLISTAKSRRFRLAAVAFRSSTKSSGPAMPSISDSP
jgi:hypothetical protein